MVFYAVVSDEIHRVLEFFRSRRDAELILARVLREEDGLRQAPAG
jgi:hypothetical protein